MWVVTITVTVPPGASDDELRTALEDGAVPAVRALPGLRSALWTVADDRTTGTGIYVFDDEAAARERAASHAVGSAAPGGATVTDVRLLRVLVDVTT